MRNTNKEREIGREKKKREKKRWTRNSILTYNDNTHQILKRGGEKKKKK
jgi:hypothetical protein